MAPAIECGTLNVNGLCSVVKQEAVLDLMWELHLDVLFVQEHNLRGDYDISLLERKCLVLLNPSRLFKGGVLILLARSSPLRVLGVEKDDDGRVLLAKVDCCGSEVVLLNVYAPSGAAGRRARDRLFSEEILYFLRHDSRRLIFGGDFNCVVEDTDRRAGSTTGLSVALRSTLACCGLRDACHVAGVVPTFTFVASRVWSRLDRFYVSRASGMVFDCQTVPVHFSDHCLVSIRFAVPSRAAVGRGYWKLNTRLLDWPGVEVLFRRFWGCQRERKRNFPDLLQWWEASKVACRRFFRSLGRQVAAERFGLLNTLQARLQSLYAKLSCGCDCTLDIRECKLRIGELRALVADSVRVRARRLQAFDGERLSRHLLSQVKVKGGAAPLTRLYASDGRAVNTTEGMLRLVTDKFETLFASSAGDSSLWDSLLAACPAVLQDVGVSSLETALSEAEVWDAVKRMRSGRVPGEDGLPADFYKKFWSVIGPDVVAMVRWCCHVGRLAPSQSVGVVKLLPKPGDLQLLDNWRPITLLNSDYKLIASVLASRLRPVLASCVSPSQFCGLPGRSIVTCNAVIRDILYFVSSSGSSAAMVSIDWAQAFDRVDVNFVLQTLRRYGVGGGFLSWLRMLYTGACSRVELNGVCGRPFPILRSVRQGCPLSMLLYIVFQDPFYRAICESPLCRAPRLPGGWVTPIFGYADDTVVFVDSPDSACEVQRVIAAFELATGALVQRGKSRMMFLGGAPPGGAWERVWFQVVSSIRSLGIDWFPEYGTTLRRNWEAVVWSLQRAVGSLVDRPLTLYQRGIVINALLLSKLWYVAHTLPLSLRVAGSVETVVFKYLWGGRYQPVRRSSLYAAWSAGGLGIVNVFAKARAILWSSVRKELAFGVAGPTLGLYYCTLLIGSILPLSPVGEVALVPAPFYYDAVMVARNLCRVRDFGSLRVKEMYARLIVWVPHRVEQDYPLFDWSRIWGGLGSGFLAPLVRAFLFRYLHEALPLNARLERCGIVSDGTCSFCGLSETSLHAFYFCPRVRESVDWLRVVLGRIGGDGLRRECFLALFWVFPVHSRKIRNALVFVVAEFLYGVWVSRRERLSGVQVLLLIRSCLHRRGWWLGEVFPERVRLWFPSGFLGMCMSV